MELKTLLKDVNNERNAILSELSESSIPLVMYGAGPSSDHAKAAFEDMGIKLAAHCVDSEYLAIRPDLLSLGSVIETFPLFNLYIGVLNYRIVMRALSSIPKSKINKVYCIDFDKYCDSRTAFTSDFFAENEMKFEKVYSLLEDKLSKDSYYAHIKTRISGNNLLINPLVPMCLQYFDKTLVNLSSKECFVDCGPYDGNSIMDLVEASGSKEHRIIAIEPDPSNAKALLDCLNQNNIANSVVINKGAWSKRDTLSFVIDNDHTRTRVSSEGAYTIDVDSIDNLVRDEPVSFIKMDIEGSELDAIKGARETILKYKPTLAICIYHKNEDLYEIPLLINEICPEYTLNMRLHSYATHEFVLYATIK